MLEGAFYWCSNVLRQTDHVIDIWIFALEATLKTLNSSVSMKKHLQASNVKALYAQWNLFLYMRAQLSWAFTLNTHSVIQWSR